jgi:hypothetical protein
MDFALARYNSDGSLDTSFGALTSDTIAPTVTYFFPVDEAENAACRKRDTRYLRQGSNQDEGVATTRAHRETLVVCLIKDEIPGKHRAGVRGDAAQFKPPLLRLG